MTWKIELCTDRCPEWHDGREIQARNIRGSSARDWAGATIGSAADLPGLLHYEVEQVSGSRVFLRSSLVNEFEAYHPAHAPDGRWFESEPFLSGHHQIGDTFEVGWGYRLYAGAWMPIRSFGLLMPGEAGHILHCRIASLTPDSLYPTRDRSNVNFSWYDSGLGMWRARFVGGDWLPYTTNIIIESWANEFDLQPVVPSSASADLNPIILNATVTCYII